MPTSTTQPALCTDTLKLLGDFWTLRIIEAIQQEALRYCEIQRTVGNINPVTLGNRLQKLEQAGIITRTKEAADKIPVSYSLTALGKEALPILSALNTFSKKISAACVF